MSKLAIRAAIDEMVLNRRASTDRAQGVENSTHASGQTGISWRSVHGRRLGEPNFEVSPLNGPKAGVGPTPTTVLWQRMGLADRHFVHSPGQLCITFLGVSGRRESDRAARARSAITGRTHRRRDP